MIPIFQMGTLRTQGQKFRLGSGRVARPGVCVLGYRARGGLSGCADGRASLLLPLSQSHLQGLEPSSGVPFSSVTLLSQQCPEQPLPCWGGEASWWQGAAVCGG